ncbi:MAG: histidine phosphatase family protein [Desulfobacca sp.]|nr:histidine phosphatase family protein [Desulfobacca sp.]
MTQIILVRHGQTPWNKDKIFRGSKDIPLNDQGQEEARLAGEWLKDETINAAYTSPLSRSRETALAIAQHHNLEVQDLAGLSDLCYGDWEGLPLTEVKVKYADLYRQWETAPHTVRFPGGETLEELRSRALAAVQDVVQRHPDQVVLLSAHRAVNKVLIAALIGLDNSHFWRIGQDTTAINQFSYVDGVWQILSLNEVCHLRGMQRGAYVDF